MTDATGTDPPGHRQPSSDTAIRAALVEDQRRRELLREVFDGDAELYHRVRPGYPAALYDDLAELAGAGQGTRVLEIGCGTGQATAELARRGCQVTAVELGAGMAAVARRELAGLDVVVQVAAFEDWPLPDEPFDLVFCATAYHWLDPAVRTGKAASALRPGGALAVVSTDHIAGGDTAFFAEAQDCYLRWDPETPPGVTLPDEVAKDTEEFAACPLLGEPVVRDHTWLADYDRDRYLELLGTYSGHRALSAERRAGLLHCLGALIDRHGGQVSKAYLTRLTLTHRV